MTKVRYQVFAMNFVACLINYGDRIALSVAAPFILAEFHFSPALWGVILSAFFWTYSPFALFGGFMVDRIGVRKAYTICMLVWSRTTPLTASAWSAASLIVARLLFGAGEGPQAPISTKLTANWFPMRQTSSMLNLAQSGTTIGPIIAIPLVVWACTSIGWRPTFVILGVFGVVWGAVWGVVARGRAREHPRAPPPHAGRDRGRASVLGAAAHAVRACPRDSVFCLFVGAVHVPHLVPDLPRERARGQQGRS